MPNSKGYTPKTAALAYVFDMLSNRVENAYSVAEEVYGVKSESGKAAFIRHLEKERGRIRSRLEARGIGTGA